MKVKNKEQLLMVDVIKDISVIMSAGDAKEDAMLIIICISCIKDKILVDMCDNSVRNI